MIQHVFLLRIVHSSNLSTFNIINFSCYVNDQHKTKIPALEVANTEIVFSGIKYHIAQCNTLAFIRHQPASGLRYSPPPSALQQPL